MDFKLAYDNRKNLALLKMNIPHKSVRFCQQVFKKFTAFCAYSRETLFWILAVNKDKKKIMMLTLQLTLVIKCGELKAKSVHILAYALLPVGILSR